jgi:putative endopeptidase
MPKSRRNKRQSQNRSRKSTSQRLPSQPHIPSPRQSVKPGNDFYQYVNANWIRHANMPPFLSSYGVSEEIEEQVNKELMTILDDSRAIVQKTADKKIPHTTYLLGTLTESALNHKVQSNNIKYLQRIVTGFRCIRDQNDVANIIAECIKNGINTMLSIQIVPSETDSSVLRFGIGPGDVGLPDLSYYSKQDMASDKKRTLAAYSKLLKRLGEDFDVEGLERYVGFETILAEEIVQSRRDEEILMKGSELQRNFSAIPWDILFQTMAGWTPSKFKSHTFLVFSKSWVNQLNRWFRTLPLETWKLYFSANTILHILPLLPPPYDELEFELFGHRMRGQSEKLPQRRLALRVAQVWLSGSLGYLFAKQFVTPLIKRQAYSIANEIRQVAAERAGATEWLETKTRAIAGKKVQNIYLGVAYPAVIERDDQTKLNPENLVENVLNLATLKFQDSLENVGKTLQPQKWEDPIFAVNAYYYNEGNRLILPAGILRWPFFHPAASDGWNFGGLGAVIGHEITHAFDNEGKDFDEHGNLRPWWSKQESEHYHKKTSALIELYNSTTYFGQHLNGVLTLSENIADLGGVSIALAALKKRLAAKKVAHAVYKKELCEFFTSFAVSWRTKEKKEKAIQSLFMDVHAPPSARVNNIVSQFDDWYECFNVQPGNVLYKDTTHRIRIF